jgi:putative transposase
MARRKAPAIPDEMLDQLLSGSSASTAFDQGGLLDQLKKALAERALNAEMDHHLAGEGGTRNSRNGYGRKSVVTDTGRIALEIPRDRQGSFDPQLIAKYQRRFAGFDEKIVSMYARGMSTREIAGHLEELYGIEVSPDLISTVTDAVLDEIATWQARPLEPIYPLVFFDALRVKLRDEGLVRNKAVHIALGVRADGTKEILGLWLEQNEGAKFWLRVMNELRNRGVEDILLAVVDGLKGFPEAIQAAFPEATVQTCIVHLLRHSLDFVSWKDRKAVAAALKDIYRALGPGGGGGRLGRVRGWSLGPQIRRHRPKLAPRLGRGRAVLRVSRRGPPDPLHHERHRGAERQAAQRRPRPGPFPDRRGRAQTAVSGLEQDREGMDHAVAGCDAAPVLEAAEGNLDAVALAIERLVVWDRHFPVLLGRDAGGDAALGECGSKRIAVVAAVGDQLARGRQKRGEDVGALLVVHLPCGEHHHDRAALAVADSVELGVQPALGAADAPIRRPLLSKLAAVRCALRWVLSMISRSGSPASPARAAKMRLNTPMRLQRTKRL